MVVKKSEALRWVARQWGSWTEKDVILNVDGMLRELHKNGHGTLLHMQEQLF